MSDTAGNGCRNRGICARLRPPALPGDGYSKNNVSALELVRQLGRAIARPGAQAQDHGAMRVGQQRRELDGRVEMDDAYLGGERPPAGGGKVGRRSGNKLPFVAAGADHPSASPTIVGPQDSASSPGR